MSLNDLLKEHRKVHAQAAMIARLKSTMASQQKGMEVLADRLNEQDSKIQKVSTQVEMSKPARHVVVSDR